MLFQDRSEVHVLSVKIKEEDVQGAVFRARYGHYEFLGMSFGLMNAPTAFMDLISKVLVGFWITPLLSSLTVPR